MKFFFFFFFTSLGLKETLHSFFLWDCIRSTFFLPKENHETVRMGEGSSSGTVTNTRIAYLSSSYPKLTSISLVSIPVNSLIRIVISVVVTSSTLTLPSSSITISRLHHHRMVFNPTYPMRAAPRARTNGIHFLLHKIWETRFVSPN